MSQNGAKPNAGSNEWARVKLVQGQSTAGLWDLSSEVPEARIAVGSAAEAGWRVVAPGVDATHFELFWDGMSLWVSPGRATPVLVDGVPVSDWRQIIGRAQIDFGDGQMTVESSFTGAHPVSSDFAEDLGGATVASDFSDFADEDDDGVKTAVFDPNRHSMPDAPPKEEEFQVGSTRLVKMPAHGGPARGAASQASAGQPRMPSHGAPRPGHGAGASAPEAAPTVGAGVPVASSAAAPRFGGAAAGAPPPAPVTAPLDTESTRILDTSAHGSAPPGGEFGEAGSTRILDTSADPAFGGQAALPQVGAGTSGGLEQERPTFVPDTFKAAQTTDVVGTKEPTGRFAPPPPSASAASNPLLEKLKAVPKRTLILAGVTFVVAIIGLGVVVSQHSADQAIEDARVQFEAQQQQIASLAAARSTQALEAREARESRRQARRQAALAEQPPPPALPTTDANGDPLDPEDVASARAEAAERRANAERAAVDLISRNDFAHALPLYLRLARDYPDEPSFAAMATILESKIEAYCRLPASAGAEVCQ